MRGFFHGVKYAIWIAKEIFVAGFDAVAKNLADAVAVPAGYTASVLYRLGDPIAAPQGQRR